MTTAELFSEFLANLAITNQDVISGRYGEITCALNKRFRETDSNTANALQVGSIGRSTAIDGISDLDMLYIMPKSKWEKYKDGKQSKLLQDTKEAILSRYPQTDVRVDRLVVAAYYKDFHIEVQPVFEEDDSSFTYPDTKGDGSWKTTKPREEIAETSRSDVAKNSNLRRLCKMARAWKNKQGAVMSGLLIDTLANNFLSTTNYYDTKSYNYFDELSRDFFKYLSELEHQDYYAAIGSGQRVHVKKKFQRKAKRAYNLALEAISSSANANVHDKWKRIFGRQFPSRKESVAEHSTTPAKAQYRNTEEFIEDRLPVDISEYLSIECEVRQDGFRDKILSEMRELGIPLLPNKRLRFLISKNTTAMPYSIYWKVLNRGEAAIKRDCIRGQIVPDGGANERTETTNFSGDHVVECYCVRDNVVVAKDRIHVPIALE